MKNGRKTKERQKKEWKEKEGSNGRTLKTKEGKGNRVKLTRKETNRRIKQMNVGVKACDKEREVPLLCQFTS